MGSIKTWAQALAIPAVTPTHDEIQHVYNRDSFVKSLTLAQTPLAYRIA